MQNNYRPLKNGLEIQKNKNGLVQSRKKRGFDFYLGHLDTRLFDFMIKELGKDTLIDNLFKRCRVAQKLWGDKSVTLVITAVIDQLMRRNSHFPRVNLTSECRYDVAVALLEELKERYPQAEDRVAQKLQRLLKIRERFNDNYRNRSNKRRVRRTTNNK